MTYPGAIPQPSTPGFVSGGGGHVVDPRIGGFERGMRTLLDAIAARKRQELEEAQFKMDQQKQVQAVQMTEELGRGLKALTNKLGMPVPGMSIPNAGGMPLTFGAKQADPTQAAFASMSDYAAGKMAPVVQPGIQQEIFRRQQEQGEVSKSPSKGQLTADVEGWAMSFDPIAQSLVYVTDAKGNRIKLRASNRSRPVLLNTIINTKDGRAANTFLDADGNVIIRPIPEGWMVKGQASSDAFKALNRYNSGLEAFKALKANGMPVLSKEAVTAIAQLSKARGSGGTIGYLLANSVLSAEDRNAIETWSALVAAKTYKESGAAVTVQEFTRNMNNYIPTYLDKENDAKVGGYRRKVNTLVKGMEADEQQARIAGLLIGQPPEDLNQYIVNDQGLNDQGLMEVPDQ